MKVFTDDTDTFIAADLADLREVWREHIGAKTEDDMADFDEGQWEEVPPHKPIKIWCDPEGRPNEPHIKGNAVVVQTAAEWVATQPRGMLCSTEC